MVYEEFSASMSDDFMNNIKRLKGGMNKQKVKISPDLTTSGPNNITTFRLPLSSLIDFNSISMYFTAVGSGAQTVIPARYSSSFIKRLSVSFNGVSCAIINDYNLVYNTFADMHNKGKTRAFGENLDPSVNWGEGAGSASLVALTATAGTKSDVAQMNEKLVINNFIGLLNSLSSPIINTDLTGTCEIQVQWSPVYECLALLGGASDATTETYTLNDIYLTANLISFTDDDYYAQLASKDKVYYGFKDYVVSRFASVAKNNNINITNYISASSIDALVATCILPETAPTRLVSYFGDGDGSTPAEIGSQAEILADPINFANSVGLLNNGDAFNQVKALQRHASHLKTGVFSINNKQLHYGPLSPLEIHQGNLSALNNMNVDSSPASYHEGCLSLYHWLKYYFFHMESLEMIDTSKFLLSGLNSSGASASINYQATFDGASNTVIPVMIVCVSRVMQVEKGRKISVM
mgnify:CR=1 FL=1